MVKNFESNFKLDKKYLTSLLEKVEIDNYKKIYIYCKFKTNNTSSRGALPTN